ncbi:40S ribosomal protein S8 [Culex quinquefasciatus]|uniref:40S ribosomal protein S8 n=1 Tax=Culex quinquefasciatus TaxID=7176 RepID=B0WX89_CULQU|nr:40S ribosomal protein S8 [Culex quinquefasciatus]|eukprot:XP_001862011.1 40S ribosomal protein S8 [Culex quinquefasciatus]
MLPQGTYHPRITYNLYNASNNELVRTKLFKNAIIVIDVARSAGGTSATTCFLKASEEDVLAKKGS